MKRAVVVGSVVLAVAGCGSSTHRPQPEPPRLPRALAQAWARQADAAAAALAGGNLCAARAHATALQHDVIAAIDAHRVPSRLLEPLSSGVNDLVSRTSCPPSPAPRPQAAHGGGPRPAGPPGKAKGRDDGKDRGNGKGRGRGKSDG